MRVSDWPTMDAVQLPRNHRARGGWSAPELMQMTYRIGADEEVERAVRRIGGEQIERALADIDGAECDVVRAVHEVRKRCKKIRGLLRLVRPELGIAYRQENIWFRDTARRLSGTRDLQVMGRTFDSLVDEHPDSAAAARFAPLRERLYERHAGGEPSPDRVRALLEEVRPAFEQALARSQRWRVSAEEFAALEGGLRLTFRRGRRGLGSVARQASAPAVHEWRKRAKYHWYHARLLADCWRPVMDAWRGEAHLLSEELGDAHDVAVLRQALATDVEWLHGAPALREMLELADRRHERLISQALARGSRLYSEKPSRLVARLGRYWRAWREGSGHASAGDAPAETGALRSNSPAHVRVATR